MDGNAVNEQHDRLPLGDFIASQRRAAEMSLRQLAERAGISNPYVSQIERGLRKPSAEVLNQIATALSVSAESLYVRAGILDPEETRPTSVERSIIGDPVLTAAQKKALTSVYRAFVHEDEPEPTTPQPKPEDPAHPEE